MFRFACSVMLWGGRGAADKYHWPVWGALVVFRPHWVCPCWGPVCVLSLSTLLRLQAALQGAGPVLRGLPRPKPLRFRFSGFPQRRRLGWAYVLCLSGRSSSGRPELEERTLPGCGAPSPLRGPSLSFPVLRSGAPCVSSGELDSSCDPPSGCRPSRISRKSLVRSWRPVCSLVGDAVSGAEFASFPSPLPPASRRGWAGLLLASSSLAFAQSFVLGTSG